MSYINKEQAIDLIESMIADKGVAFNPHKLAMTLKDIPSMEIVRCKDCIDNDANCSGEENWCLQFGYDVDDDDYCSYGEKQVTGKLENSENATSEGDESTMGQPKSKLYTDLISRQAAIEAVEKAVIKDVAKSAIESLPPVEPERPKGGVVQTDNRPFRLLGMFGVWHRSWN